MRVSARLLPLVFLGVAALLWTGTTGTASASPPTPPAEATARAQLAALTVSAPHPMTGYSRKKFPHWHSVSGACNTRETVLKRDGTGVETNASCYPTAGRWYSVYDRAWFDAPADVSIDHVVALANAWRSGADRWTNAEREAFANDLDSAQLVVASVDSNTRKGDQSPDQWKPANTGHWCLYARGWIDVKHGWKLNITAAEKAALASMLDRC
jgi:hypothetical protein